MEKVKDFFVMAFKAFLSAMKWENMQWSILRPLIISLTKKLIISVLGPTGWIVKAILKVVPYVLDKYAKPIFLLAKRKLVKKGNVKKGKKQAKEVRDASTDNVDDIYDKLNK